MKEDSPVKAKLKEALQHYSVSRLLRIPLRDNINAMLQAVGHTPAGNAVDDLDELTTNFYLIYNSKGGKALMDIHPLGKSYREFFDYLLKTPAKKAP